MHRRLAAVVALLGLALVLLDGRAAEAQAGPAVVVTPDTGLRDGDTVQVTALNFFNLTFPLDSSPGAYQCRAGVFPASSVAPLEAVPILSDLLNHNCSFVGRFPARGSNFDPAPPTSLDIVVHTSLTLGDGSTLLCGQSAGDCVVVAAGLTPPSNVGVAATPISFLPPTPTSKAECKSGGWRTVADDQGRPFPNEGQCVRFVAAGRR